MKIAHVITRLIVGGAQENTILTCEGLTRRGHDVTLIAGLETGAEGSLWARARKSCAHVIQVRTMRRDVHPLDDLRCARRLESIFRQRRFDVVHTHSSKAGILGREAAQRAAVPVVVHTIHGMSFNRTQKRWSHSAFRYLEQRAAAGTDAFICVADAMTHQALAAGVGDPDKFFTIRSGMETEQFRPDPEARQAVRKSWGVGDNDVVVGTVARLFRNKGYEQLLEILPSLTAARPNVRFVWVGDGKHRKRYLRALKRLRLSERVHLTGLVPPGAIPRLINGFDVLVHTSQWEGLARAIVQASLIEVPSVSFDNDGASEVIDDGTTGLLAPFGDTSALCEHLVRLCSDPDLRASMGRAARQRCLEPYDHELMVREIEDLYTRLHASS